MSRAWSSSWYQTPSHPAVNVCVCVCVLVLGNCSGVFLLRCPNSGVLSNPALQLFFFPSFFCCFFPNPPSPSSPHLSSVAHWISLLLPSPHWVCVYGVIRDMHAEIISSIKNLQLDGEDPRKLLQSWGRLRFPRHVLQWVCRQTQPQLLSRSVWSSRLRQTLQLVRPPMCSAWTILIRAVQYTVLVSS